jgi:hypothetical protein
LQIVKAAVFQPAADFFDIGTAETESVGVLFGGEEFMVLRGAAVLLGFEELIEIGALGGGHGEMQGHARQGLAARNGALIHGDAARDTKRNKARCVVVENYGLRVLNGGGYAGLGLGGWD